MSKYILICLTSVLISVSSYGRHIIGGDVFYDVISVDTMANTALIWVEFQMFRDGRPPVTEDTAEYFDPNARFGVYRRTSANRWEYVQEAGPLNIVLEEPVPINDLKCLRSGIDLENLRGVYRFQLTLDIIDAEYMIAFQRCCRGARVTNIRNARDEGSAFTLNITKAGLTEGVTGYRFKEFPPSVICVNFPFEFDHSVPMQEGDSIVYQICNPVASGGISQTDTRGCNAVIPAPNGCLPHQFREVNFNFPYTRENPLGPSDDPIAIDALSGRITVTPRYTGEMVMAVCATVYRDTAELMMLRRDMQFKVVECERQIDAIVASNKTLDDGTFDVLVCGDLDVQFQSLSTELRYIDEYAWRFELPDGTQTSSLKDPFVSYPGIGDYQAKLVVNPNSFVCIDSADILVRLRPDVEADFAFDYDTCVVSDIEFMDESVSSGDGIVRWLWDFGDGQISNLRDPIHQFRRPGQQFVSLQVTDQNECVAETTKDFFYTPIPEELAVLPSFYITCTPGVVTFDNLSEPIDSTYQVKWDFGDDTNGPESTEQSPTHVYEQPGVYTIILEITSPTGCVATQTFKDFVTILDGFEIDFDYSPEAPTIQRNIVTFTGESIVSGDAYWDFGDGSFSTEQVPRHAYQDTGWYNVRYQITDGQGCIDTITKPLYVSPYVEIAYPNAFSPDNDGKNDLFAGRAEGAVDYMRDFTLQIFDRWGKIVFTSSDPAEGWNGRLNNSGQALPMGVYTFLATYELPRIGPQEQRGVATLVR